jgi:hypothetical protein
MTKHDLSEGQVIGLIAIIALIIAIVLLLGSLP